MVRIIAISLILLVAIRSHAQITKDKFGAIVRGDTSRKQIALVFTGDEFGDGGEIILGVLTHHQIKASFFLTGNFYRNASFQNLIHHLQEHRHYLGPHSNTHLRYANWEKRDSLLVTQALFSQDLLGNYHAMATLGIKKHEATYFIPPFEWYNKKIVEWAAALQVRLINFTPGTRSPADYTVPGMKNYESSERIYQSIMSFESRHPAGLNGFILLSHIGTDPQRTDKFYFKLHQLITELRGKGYRFVRVDEMLDPAE